MNLDIRHWQIEGFKQRMTTKEWRKVLLDGDDKIICKGRLRQLAVSNLGGFGAVEISKEPLKKET